MEFLYHGSSKRGLETLLPMNSTHGKYVYATPFKELAIIFSKRCGDDLTYALYRSNQNEPFKIVELIPKAFETMFDNSASIYTLPADSFKDIHTGFSELVSSESVDIVSEEYIDNVYDAIIDLEKEGKIEIYNYPDKPKDFYERNRDLIEKELNSRYAKSLDKLSNNIFKRLVLLHPELLDDVNKKTS